MAVLGAGDAEGLVVGHVGACGSGKTYRLKARVASALRAGWRGTFLVLDVKGEWPMRDGSGERGPLLSGSAIDMARCHLPPIDRAWPALLVCRPRGDEQREGEAGVSWADEVCRRALDRGGVIVVAPEMYRYAREGYPLAPSIAELVHEYRHRACGLWWDAQSFPEVKKELVRRSGYLWIHGTGAHEDVRRLARMGGDALARAVVDAQRRNVQGRAGHHVIFRIAMPLPPYVVRSPEGRELARFG